MTMTEVALPSLPNEAPARPTALDMERQMGEQATTSGPPVRSPEEVHADMIDAAQAEAESDVLTVTFSGVKVRARTHRPAGAFAVMCARLKSSSELTQTAAPLQLLQAWIEPEDHDKLLDAIGEVDDLETWMAGEFRQAMEVLAQRPSQAP